MSSEKNIDDLESLNDSGTANGGRPEPEDDYYIRNYVLSESEASDAGADSRKQASVEQQPVQIAQAGKEPGSDNSNQAATTAVAPQAAPATRPARPAGRMPPVTRGTALTDTLSELLTSNPDLEAAALVSLDGLPMAAVMPESMQEDRVAAMSAAILGLGERAAAELGRGPLNQVFVEGESGYVFLMAAGGKAVLTALARRNVKIGLVFYDLKQAAQRVADIL